MPHVDIQSIGSRRLNKWKAQFGGTINYLRRHREPHLIQPDPDTGEEQTWDMGERIGTVVPTDRRLFIRRRQRHCLLQPRREKTSIADPEAAMRETNRFTTECDPAGRFWAGMISLTKQTGSANLYCLDTDGSLSLKIPEVTNSNGICWSADAKTVYYIDTPTRQIRAYNYDITTGEIANARIAIDTEALGFDSSPDGMTIDTEDKLWVAFCHGGCVARFDPVAGTSPTGRLSRRKPRPALLAARIWIVSLSQPASTKPSKNRSGKILLSTTGVRSQPLRGPE